MLLKPALRYGLPDGRDMLVHHFASLALILISYGACASTALGHEFSLLAASQPGSPHGPVCACVGGWNRE